MALLGFQHHHQLEGIWGGPGIRKTHLEDGGEWDHGRKIAEAHQPDISARVASIASKPTDFICGGDSGRGIGHPEICRDSTKQYGVRAKVEESVQDARCNGRSCILYHVYNRCSLHILRLISINQGNHGTPEKRTTHTGITG